MQEYEAYNLSPAQVLALDALLEGKSQRQAGIVAGVTRQTVHRWLHEEPEFTAAYKKLAKELLEYSIHRQKQGRAAGLDALIEIATDPNAGERNRVEAAKALINLPLPEDADEEDTEGAVIYFPAKGSITITANPLHESPEEPEEEPDE